MMRLFDEHPNVIAWASEFVNIPYQNPITGKWTIYIPDFLAVYVDRDGKKHAEVVEVKPAKEVASYWDNKKKGKLNERGKLIQAINSAKWAAALQFCARQGFGFRIMSQDEIFAWEKPKKKKK